MSVAWLVPIFAVFVPVVDRVVNAARSVVVHPWLAVLLAHLWRTVLPAVLRQVNRPSCPDGLIESDAFARSVFFLGLLFLAFFGQEYRTADDCSKESQGPERGGYTDQHVCVEARIRARSGACSAVVTSGHKHLSYCSRGRCQRQKSYKNIFKVIVAIRRNESDQEVVLFCGIRRLITLKRISMHFCVGVDHNSRKKHFDLRTDFDLFLLDFGS